MLCRSEKKRHVARLYNTIKLDMLLKLFEWVVDKLFAISYNRYNNLRNKTTAKIHTGKTTTLHNQVTYRKLFFTK